ncbi:MAG TPA: surface-adhesin E family protein [Pyrinomonadaceae bacterium]
MRIVILTVLVLVSSTSVFSQKLPTWFRVYTFDESTVEMNTAVVTFITHDISRVRFRWTFNKPETLNGEPKVKYQSRLEVIEFKCSESQYRPYHLTFLDAAGKMVRLEEMDPPGEWRAATSGSMMEKLLKPACALVKQKTNPPVVSRDEIELQKAAKYALVFSQRLEHAKDFKPMVEKFFAADYLDGYLHDQDTNWFWNLDRETAAKASRVELQRFYVALLNSVYFSYVYLISQYPRVDEGLIPEQKLIPPDIVDFIDNHPYSARYKGKHDNHNYLAENIDGVDRLRSYTSLLEGIGALMRKHVTAVRAEHSREYRTILGDIDLYQPKVRICSTDCLGLPRGTRLFDVNVPVFHLQLAEIKGELKVVSVTDYFH